MKDFFESFHTSSFQLRLHQEDDLGIPPLQKISQRPNCPGVPKSLAIPPKGNHCVRSTIDIVVLGGEASLQSFFWVLLSSFSKDSKLLGHLVLTSTQRVDISTS